MRYRSLDDSGDYVFGRGPAEFLVNSPDAVAQAIKTRLLLPTAEWFLDLEEGTPYNTQVLGTGTQALYDNAIKDRILNTQGMLSIDAYTSVLQNRQLSVECTVTTIYGSTSVAAIVPTSFSDFARFDESQFDNGAVFG